MGNLYHSLSAPVNKQKDVSQSDRRSDEVTHAVLSQFLSINKKTSARVMEEPMR